MSWAIARSIFRMFSACCCSWLWVLNCDSLVTPSTSWATSGAELLLDVGQAVARCPRGRRGGAPPGWPIVSMPSSARIWADAIGCVTNGLAGRAAAGPRGRRPRGRRRAPTGSRSALRRAPRGSPRSRSARSALEIGALARRGRGDGRRPPWTAARLGLAAALVFGAGRSLSPCFGGSRWPSPKDTPSAEPGAAQGVLGLGPLVPRRRAVGAR
mgnify:CR=1 FL=1